MSEQLHPLTSQNHQNSADLLLISAKEVARILCMSERTVWRHQSSGKIPQPVRIGGTVRWRQQEITEWVDSGCPELSDDVKLRKTVHEVL